MLRLWLSYFFISFLFLGCKLLRPGTAGSISGYGVRGFDRPCSKQGGAGTAGGRFVVCSGAVMQSAGLGLGKEKWRKFRAAWKVVNEHPYLKNLPLSYVAVNDLATEAKKLEIEFPSDLQKYKDFRAQAQQLKDAEKQQKTANLQAEIARLKAKVQEQDKQIAGLQGENRILIENNKEITGKLEQAMVQAGVRKKALKTPENETDTSMTRWQHFMAIFLWK
ncbi:hypothetical protein [Endozoicomonas sp.]|uniref:hypothetical protein n=1 Tax=Endozoicomonas sp. TaxID=1892382 RepID=UPI00383B34EE